MTDNNDPTTTITPAQTDPTGTPDPAGTPAPIIDDDREKRINKNASYYSRHTDELLDVLDKVNAIATPTKEATVSERVDRLERAKVADKIVAETGISADDYKRYIKGNSESELRENTISFLERDYARSKQGEGENPVVPGTDIPVSIPAPALPQYTGKEDGKAASQAAQETAASMSEEPWFKDLPD